MSPEDLTIDQLPGIIFNALAIWKIIDIIWLIGSAIANHVRII